MLSPKRTKFRKKQRRVKRTMLGAATRGNEISFGEHGLVSVASGWITNRQIEAARIAMTRHMKRGGKVWIRIFPDIPYTKKPAETRMGKGKGAPEYWVAAVRPGTVMFEVAGVTNELAESAMKLASSKLPIKTKFVSRRDVALMRNSFKELTFDELLTKREELKRQYRELRFNMVVGHVDNPLQKRTMRRQIARLNTLIYNHADVAGSSTGSEE